MIDELVKNMFNLDNYYYYYYFPIQSNAQEGDQLLTPMFLHQNYKTDWQGVSLHTNHKNIYPSLHMIKFQVTNQRKREVI